MNIINPHMLPKVRSDAMRNSCRDYPCALRIGTFIGIPCSGEDTTVGAHPPIFGKGTSTKVTDLGLICGCHSCHDLLDWERNPQGRVIRERYTEAFWVQVMKAILETQSRWLDDGIIIVPDGRIII